MPQTTGWVSTRRIGRRPGRPVIGRTSLGAQDVEIREQEIVRQIDGRAAERPRDRRTRAEDAVRVDGGVAEHLELAAGQALLSMRGGTDQK